MSLSKKSLVDSDVWIRLLRREPDTVEFMRDLSCRQRILCSVITLAELHAGQRPEKQEQLYWALRNAQHIPVTSEIAIQGGIFHYQYGPSHGSELADCLIAASAKAYKANLVTYNERHFPMPGIRVMAPR